MSGEQGFKGDLKQGIFDAVNENVKALEALFPAAVKDGQVDFEALKEELGQFEEVGAEKYGLTWSGKQNAKKIALEDSIGRTLKFVPEESVASDTTENLYIEGDNLEVLKLLRQNYYGAIKMIYIDPPYNTGNDFIYNDKFRMDLSESDIAEGQVGDDKDRYTINQKTGNRYHANWLNMIYPRIKVAKDLLKEDGVLFLSIDDNEVENAKKVLNEVFGECNKVAEFVVIRAEGGGMAKQVIKGHDYLFAYAKNISRFTPLGRPKDIRGKIIERDGEKFWIQEDWLRKEFGKYGNCHYEEIIEFKGIDKKKEIDEGIERGLYVLIPKSNGMNIVGKLRNVNEDSSKFYSILKHLSANGIEDLKMIEMDKYFDYPKPVSLLKELVKGATFFTSKENDIIMDFFSGSATTAHAVMQLNAEDGGNRKFIMVQIPETCDEKSEAKKAGYNTICEIGKERIKRAGNKIKQEIEESNAKLQIGDTLKAIPDIGFKVFKTADTMIRWNYEDIQLQRTYLESAATGEVLEGQSLVGAHMMNHKDQLDFMPYATDVDVVYEILLRQRDIPLSAPIEQFSEIGKRTYLFADSFLVCLETEITTELIEKIAALRPLPIKFILRDSAFGDDINLKDETIRRFKALVARNTNKKQSAYTVEFI